MTTPRRPWRAFLVTLAGAAGGLGLLLAAFIVVIDPHDHLALSPDWPRVPINPNQRFSYPAIARSGRFDSLVVGTSTARMLRPATLDEAFGGRFANLSMNSATAYEQYRIAEVYLRHHPRPRAVVIGVDRVWCERGERYERYTFREFPEWLYDGDPWNDLRHLFNLGTLEQAIRHLEYWLGRRAPRYGNDGYRNFLPSAAEYDLERARELLYGAGGVRPRTAPATAVEPSPGERSRWRYPTHALYEALLGGLPPETLKIAFFVPYHHFHQPFPGTLAHAEMAECKRRITRLTTAAPNSHVVDLMLDSSLTREDRNYWDPLHYTAEVAEELVELIARSVRARDDLRDTVVYLGGGPPPAAERDRAARW